MERMQLIKRMQLHDSGVDNVPVGNAAVILTGHEV